MTHDYERQASAANLGLPSGEREEPSETMLSLPFNRLKEGASGALATVEHGVLEDPLYAIR